MRYGVEKETVTIDKATNSTRTMIRKIRGYEVAQTYKQYILREKVSGKQQEMSLYIKFTELISKLREDGTLLIKDEDPTMLPAFTIEYPRHNVDGSYFVIKRWTEIV